MRTKKLLETKLDSKNLIKGINTWDVPLIIYTGPFLKWMREELHMWTREQEKLMMIHKILHPGDDVHRPHESRKEGGRRLDNIQDSIDASIQRLENYIKKERRGKLITATRNNAYNTRINGTKMTRKQKWKKKQLYGHFKRQPSEISSEKTWT